MGGPQSGPTSEGKTPVTQTKSRMRWVPVGRWPYFLGASICLLIAVAIVRAHPIWYAGESGVRSWALREVPPGSNIEQLKQVARAHGWQLNNTWRGDEPHGDWGEISGATIAWVSLGGRRLIFRTDFDSFWAFDEQGHLLDVRVRQMTDSL